MMASNTHPERHLGPPCSLAAGASDFIVGELILVRIPEPIRVGGYVDDEATAAGTNLPPTSNGRSPQHFAFIRQANPQPGGSYLLEVYPVVSFTRSGGALACYNQLDDNRKAILLPLPPLSLRHPTPEAFGAPLEIRGWSNTRDSWLIVKPMRFFMPFDRPFKRMVPPLVMSAGTMYRIDVYRETLRPNPQTTNVMQNNDQNPPPPNGGYQDERTNPGQGHIGGGGGPTASEQASIIASSTIIGDGGPKTTTETEMEDFMSDITPSLLVLEGVDDDAETADADMLDELRLLAHADPMWMKELQKYLKNEEQEREEMQKERVMSVARWREGLTTPPI